MGADPPVFCKMIRQTWEKIATTANIKALGRQPFLFLPQSLPGNLRANCGFFKISPLTGLDVKEKQRRKSTSFSPQASSDLSPTPTAMIVNAQEDNSILDWSPLVTKLEDRFMTAISLLTDGCVTT